MNQEEIWAEYIKDLTVEDVVDNYNNPAIFQKELKDLIEQYSKLYKNTIEVGCETGVTSLLMDDSFSKTFLDLNPLAIDLVQGAANKLGKSGTFIVADMFDMPFDDKSFDVVFNAGVIEHFTKSERIDALSEYARILKDEGVIFIGFPNHYSVPYRLAYVLRNLFKKWPYPEEYKIYDMKEEIAKSNMVLENRVVLSKKSVFNWLSFAKPLEKLFILLDKVFNFEGYLVVLIVRKGG